MGDQELTNATAEDLKLMGLPASFTLEQLSGFSAEEIAAMSQGDDPLIDPESLPPEIKAATVKKRSAYDEVFDNAEDDDGTEYELDANGDPILPDGEGDGEGDVGGDGDGTGTEAETAGTADDPATGTATDDEPDPAFELKPTTDLEAKIGGFDEELEKLQAQFDDAELTQAEFNAKLKAMTREQAQAEVALDRIKAENDAILADFSKTWHTKVQKFTADKPELMDNTPIPGVFDARGVPMSGLTAFDNALKYITGHPEAKVQHAGLTMAQKIALAASWADGYVKEATGQPLIKGKAAPKPDPKTTPAPKNKEKPGPRKDPRPEALTTLAGAIAATENDVDDSRFAAIEALDGLEYEKAVSRLSSEDRERWLKRG